MTKYISTIVLLVTVPSHAMAGVGTAAVNVNMRIVSIETRGTEFAGVDCDEGEYDELIAQLRGEVMYEDDVEDECVVVTI